MHATFLSIDPVSQTFGLNPSTVFGVLAGLLLLAVVMLWREVKSKDKTIALLNSTQREELQQLHAETKQEVLAIMRDNLTTLNELGKANAAVSESVAAYSSEAKEAIQVVGSQIAASEIRIVDAINRQVSNT